VAESLASWRTDFSNPLLTTTTAFIIKLNGHSTMAGARALGLEAVTGSLTPGKAADIVLVRGADINVAPLADVESAVVRSVTPANVDTVLVDGVFVKRSGELVGIDAAAIVRAATEAAERIRRTAGSPLAPEGTDGATEQAAT